MQKEDLVHKEIQQEEKRTTLDDNTRFLLVQNMEIVITLSFSNEIKEHNDKDNENTFNVIGNIIVMIGNDITFDERKSSGIMEANLDVPSDIVIIIAVKKIGLNLSNNNNTNPNDF